MAVKSKTELDLDNLTGYVSYLLANHCMPTLLHAKPSNLFRIKKGGFSLDGLLTAIDRGIIPFRCKSYVIYENSSDLLLLIYQTGLFLRTFCEPENRAFLGSFGYVIPEDVALENSIPEVLSWMKQRYEDYKEKGAAFPHEFGILLGYPCRDVVDFIRYQGQNYILAGYWKVYHDKERATQIFANYKAMKAKALELIHSGKNLSKILEF